MADTAIFDVDGTLVDTNYHHALAWSRAFRAHGHSRPLWRIHRSIGMGGDRLVPELLGEEVERRIGEDLRARWSEEFEPMLAEIEPLDGARELLTEVKDRGFRLVLASSGQARHVEAFLDLVGGRDLADAWTSSDDAEQSKPEPELVETALDRVQGGSGVMVGDSVWDAVAARRIDVPTIAVRSGGFSDAELHEAGAEWVYDSLVDLREHLDETPLARPRD